jgi:hypothetical protein
MVTDGAPCYGPSVEPNVYHDVKCGGFPGVYLSAGTKDGNR